MRYKPRQPVRIETIQVVVPADLPFDKLFKKLEAMLEAEMSDEGSPIMDWAYLLPSALRIQPPVIIPVGPDPDRGEAFLDENAREL